MTASPIFTLVAAITRNGVIGASQDLVWRNRDDLQRLKAMTMGHTLIMGRRNYESIGRPLPGRRTVVLTQQKHWQPAGVTVVHNAEQHLDQVLTSIIATTGDRHMYVFGGAEIYRTLLPRVDVLELTEINAALPGDVFFPPIDWRQWRTVSRHYQATHAWVRYERLR